MNVIRRAAIVTCGFAISALMCEFTVAQTRVIRTVPSRSIRIQRVVPSSSSRRVVVPSSRYTTPSRSTASRSTRSTQSSSSRVLATKSQAEVAERREKAERADDDIPEEALLTERGVELSAQLKRLRYTESTLGARHPSLPMIQEQIVSIRRILKSWGDGQDEVAVDEKDSSEKELVIVSNEVLDSLSKDDLKQLVVKLATDLSQVRQRLDELEEDQLAADES